MNAADIAREHAKALDTLDFDKVIAALPDVIDAAMRKTLPGEYTPELAAQIAQTMTDELRHARQGASYECPVWPGVCVDTEPGHYDHHNHRNFVTDKRGERLIDVGFVQLSDEEADGPATICISGMGSEDYDPSEVHAKTAELRRLLDLADEMADKVIAARAAQAGGTR
ncbi:hypothetical protein ABZ584_24580 [Streptomyces antibioticus]|uniref:hypothetical protein n=1 Tax=Streptomyces antibioticus TaxID=1890 RepID=UPI0033FE821E